MAFVEYDGDHAKAKTGASLIDCDAVMIRAFAMDGDARGDIQIVGVLDSDTECNTAGASERPSPLDGCDKGTSVGTFESVGCLEEDTNSDADGTAEIVGTRDGPRGRSVDEVADTVGNRDSGMSSVTLGKPVELHTNPMVSLPTVYCRVLLTATSRPATNEEMNPSATKQVYKPFNVLSEGSHHGQSETYKIPTRDTNIRRDMNAQLHWRFNQMRHPLYSGTIRRPGAGTCKDGPIK